MDGRWYFLTVIYKRFINQLFLGQIYCKNIGLIIYLPRQDRYFSLLIKLAKFKQTGENIAADIDNVISQIDHSKLAAIITDNTSSMKKAWKLLAIKYPKVVFFGCVAHSLNLLVGDIMKFPWAVVL